jgi:hypothetical protein
MTFAQRRNRLTTHISERIPVVKRRISVYTASQQENFTTTTQHFKWQHIKPAGFTHVKSTASKSDSIFRRLMSTIVYRTADLQSCILYIYSTNIGTEYFKHGIYSPSFFLLYAVSFIIITYLVPVLFTFYIQDVLTLKKNSGAKRLKSCLYAWHLRCPHGTTRLPPNGFSWNFTLRIWTQICLHRTKIKIFYMKTYLYLYLSSI